MSEMKSSTVISSMKVIDTLWIYFYQLAIISWLSASTACRQNFCKYKLVFFCANLDQDTIDVQWCSIGGENIVRRELMTLIDCTSE